MREREQARKVQIGRNHDSLFGAGAGQNYNVFRIEQAQVAGVDRIMPICAQQSRQARREGHVNKKLHRDSSTVSSSASAAA